MINKQILAVLLLAGLLCSCNKQPHQEKQQGQQEQSALQNMEQIPAVTTKTEEIKTPVEKICQYDYALESNYCYSISTIEMLKTNVDWINDFLFKEIQKDYPQVFDTSINSNNEEEIASDYLSISVSFEGQRGNLVMFEIEKGIYGGAHGVLQGYDTYARKYYTFDLATKKLVTLDDFLAQSRQKTLDDFDHIKVDYDTFFNEAIQQRMEELEREYQDRILSYQLSDNFKPLPNGGAIGFINYKFAHGGTMEDFDKEIPFEYNMIKPQYRPQ